MNGRCACLIMLVAVAGGAQERMQAGTVLGVVTFAAEADPSFRSVLESSVQVQLARRVAVPDLLFAEEAEGKALEDLFALAVERKAESLLVGTYSTLEDEISIGFELYDVAGKKLLGAASAHAEIDLSLDLILAQTLDKTLAGLPQLATVEKPAPAPAPAAPVQVTTTAPPAGPTARWRYFEMSTTAAPLIPVGASADYSRLGALTSIALGLRFRLRAGSLGAGMLAGLGWFHLSGAVAEADLFLVPLGADLSCTIAAGSSPAIAFRLSGGPALVAVDAAYTGQLAKLIPYVLAGMKVEFPLAASLGVAAQATYAVFFEGSLLIMAIAPEVALYLRL